MNTIIPLCVMYVVCVLCIVCDVCVFYVCVLCVVCVVFVMCVFCVCVVFSVSFGVFFDFFGVFSFLLPFPPCFFSFIIGFGWTLGFWEYRTGVEFFGTLWVGWTTTRDTPDDY